MRIRRRPCVASPLLSPPWPQLADPSTPTQRAVEDDRAAALLGKYRSGERKQALAMSLYQTSCCDLPSSSLPEPCGTPSRGVHSAAFRESDGSDDNVIGEYQINVARMLQEESRKQPVLVETPKPAFSALSATGKTSCTDDDDDEARLAEGERKVPPANKRRRSAALVAEGSRCSRVNGRGWRCCQPTLVGYSLCEHHSGKGKIKSFISVGKGQLGCTDPKKNCGANDVGAAHSKGKKTLAHR